MKPDDPVCWISDCVRSTDECDPGISISTAPRATAQARYAAEYGLAFQEVQCLRVYVRIYTRQEAWDEHGRERESDRRQEERGVGWYFGASGLCGAAPGVTHAGYYYDDPGPDNLHRPASAEDLAYIVAPAIVPDNWEPEDDPAWYATTRDDPKAIPAWESSEF